MWFLALFLLCSPVPLSGRPIDAELSSRIKRSVTHAQLMHDKGRALQDFKRRMWLQELLDEVHTAEIRELPVRTTGAAAAAGAGAAGGSGGSSPASGPGPDPSTTGSTLHSKAPGGNKNLALGFGPEEEEGTNLPQETNKAPAFKAPGKKKKKGRSGKRREGDKRKRRVRSLRGRSFPQEGEEPGSGLHLEWRSLLGLRRALLL